MMKLSPLTDKYAVSGQIEQADLSDLVAMGYSTVVCNRPDGEEPGQPGSEEIRAACESAGLEFHLLPITGPVVDPAIVDEFIAVYRRATGPVLGYCRSGARSAVLWQLAAVELDWPTSIQHQLRDTY